jgi:branched-chain amino acid transport system ATP-binding protein
LIELKGVHSGYGRLKVIYDISLQVKEGTIISIIGANGAGKTTLLKTILGVLPCIKGEILFKDFNITDLKPYRRVDLGIIMVAEGHRVIRELSVQENLFLGCYRNYSKQGKQGRKRLMDYVYNLFPALRGRMHQISGTLSGGEQQMLAVGQALMAEPTLLLLDEPSLGLAPILIDMLLKVVRELNRKGLTVLMVEQNATLALEMSEWGFVLENGSITIRGSASDLLSNDNIKKSYLGM